MFIPGIRNGAVDTKPSRVVVSELAYLGEADDILRYLVRYPTLAYGLNLKQLTELLMKDVNMSDKLKISCALYAAINLGMYETERVGKSRILRPGRNMDWVEMSKHVQRDFQTGNVALALSSTRITGDRGDGIPVTFNKRLLPEHYFTEVSGLGNKAWMTMRDVFYKPLERYAKPLPHNVEEVTKPVALSWVDRLSGLKKALPASKELEIAGLDVMLSNSITQPTCILDPEDAEEILGFARQVGEVYIKSKREKDLAMLKEKRKRWAEDAVAAYLKGLEDAGEL